MWPIRDGITVYYRYDAASSGRDAVWYVAEHDKSFEVSIYSTAQKSTGRAELEVQTSSSAQKKVALQVLDSINVKRLAKPCKRGRFSTSSSHCFVCKWYVSRQFRSLVPTVGGRRPRADDSLERRDWEFMNMGGILGDARSSKDTIDDEWHCSTRGLPLCKCNLTYAVVVSSSSSKLAPPTRIQVSIQALRFHQRVGTKKKASDKLAFFSFAVPS